jgi:large subunit ribosomal protein L25
VSEVKLSAEPRTEFGKGAARRLRRAHMVPAVLYGHGTAPVHVALPGHATMLALKHSNTLLSVELDGTFTLALPKDIQRDPIKGFIEHVDLIIVRRGERFVVDVQVQLIGEVGPDALVTSEHPALAIEVEATAIPASLPVDIDGALPGTQILAGQIQLPEGATLVTDPSALVVNVTDASVTAEPEPEAEEAEAEEPSADAEPVPADA